MNLSELFAVILLPIFLGVFSSDVVSRLFAEKVLVPVDLRDFFWAVFQFGLFHWIRMLREIEGRVKLKDA